MNQTDHCEEKFCKVSLEIILSNCLKIIANTTVRQAACMGNEKGDIKYVQNIRQRRWRLIVSLSRGALAAVRSALRLGRGSSGLQLGRGSTGLGTSGFDLGTVVDYKRCLRLRDVLQHVGTVGTVAVLHVAQKDASHTRHACCSASPSEPSSSSMAPSPWSAPDSSSSSSSSSSLPSRPESSGWRPRWWQQGYEHLFVK
jgi:hypothetical protein